MTNPFAPPTDADQAASRAAYQRGVAATAKVTSESAVTTDFHQAFYYLRRWEGMHWMGVPTYKCPMDLWMYQQILWEIRPRLIIECGTASGGSALYLAHLLDLLGQGSLLTIDIDSGTDRPQHPRIRYVAGSSTDPQIVTRAREEADGGGPVMVILDSCHTAAHVFDELIAYRDLVTPGCYLIVEDTNIGGHPVYTDYPADSGPGPFEAVQAFLKLAPEYEIDRQREAFLMTFNPAGYLRRRSEPGA